MVEKMQRFRMSLRDLGVSVGKTLLSTMPAYGDAYPDQPKHIIWPMQLVPGDSDISAQQSK